MNLKQKLLDIKKKLIESPKEIKEEIRKNNNKLEHKTHLGCMSYEYLKIIKKIQIENGNKHNYTYLYLLLYFACRTKMITSGKNLNLFDDTFKNGYFPTPIKCQQYIYRDALDLIDNSDNVEVFICLLNEDEKIIEYVCKEYGFLPSDSLIQKYKEDRLHNMVKYMEEIPLNNPYLVNEDEKNNIVRLIKTYPHATTTRNIEFY